MSLQGQIAKDWERADNFRFAPSNGHHKARTRCRKSANNGSSLLTRSPRRRAREASGDREAERRSLGSPHGLASGLVHGFQRFTSQKNMFRPMGWSKLA